MPEKSGGVLPAKNPQERKFPAIIIIYYFQVSVRIEPSGYGRHPPLGIRPFLVTYTFCKNIWSFSSLQKPPKCAGLLSSQGPQQS
jgi:hypothetical protein